jgi:hypothetical protein
MNRAPKILYTNERDASRPNRSDMLGPRLRGNEFRISTIAHDIEDAQRPLIDN